MGAVVPQIDRNFRFSHLFLRDLHILILHGILHINITYLPQNNSKIVSKLTPFERGCHPCEILNNAHVATFVIL